MKGNTMNELWTYVHLMDDSYEIDGIVFEPSIPSEAIFISFKKLELQVQPRSFLDRLLGLPAKSKEVTTSVNLGAYYYYKPNLENLILYASNSEFERAVKSALNKLQDILQEKSRISYAKEKEMQRKENDKIESLINEYLSNRDPSFD